MKAQGRSGFEAVANLKCREAKGSFGPALAEAAKDCSATPQTIPRTPDPLLSPTSGCSKAGFGAIYGFKPELAPE